MEPQIYLITSITPDGNETQMYAMAPRHNLVRKMMMSEYGNAEIEPVALEDLPEDLRSRLITTED